MSDWNGAPWLDPQRDARERRMWDGFDYMTTRRAWSAEEAIRERDASLGDEQRSLMVELDAWWQDEVEGKHGEASETSERHGGVPLVP